MSCSIHVKNPCDFILHPCNRLYLFSYYQAILVFNLILFSCNSREQQGDIARRACCQQEEGRERTHTTGGLLVKLLNI
jgi:hypothetical protein